MIQMKTGGLVLTGIGAYLIVSKIISMVRGSVHDLAEAQKWKAYYNCDRPDPIAPGYERRTSVKKSNEDTEDIPEDGQEDGGNPPEKTKNETVLEGVGRAISDAINKSVDELFKKTEAGKTASEGPEMGDYDGDDSTIEYFGTDRDGKILHFSDAKETSPDIAGDDTPSD